MSRRSSRAARNQVDLDFELGQIDPAPPGMAIKRDNWKVSSDKARNDPAWNKTKYSLGLSLDRSGFWEYSKDGTEKFWVSKNQQRSKNIADSNEDTMSHGPFSASEGDKEISSIYHRFWLEGETKAFIDAIYEYVTQPLGICNINSGSSGNMQSMAWFRNL